MWFLVTRARPDACEGFITACSKTSLPQNVAVLVDDDKENYKSVKWPDSWKIHYSPGHLELVQATNYLLSLYPGEPFYGFLGDYCRPKTSGWDERLVEAAGDWNIAHTRNNWTNGFRPDGSGKTRIGGAICFGGDLIRELGWVWYPKMVHLFIDCIYEELGERLGLLRYLDDVVVEVDRPETTGRKRDKNHERMYKGKRFFHADRSAFNDWMCDEFEETVRRIQSKENVWVPS